MSRLPVLSFVVALAVVVAALAAACGDNGGSKLTLEEYFQRIESIIDDLDEGLTLAAPVEVDSEDDRIEVTREFYRAVAALWSDSQEAFHEIDPPTEIVSAHEEAVAARDVRAMTLQDLAEQLESGDSVAELEAVFAQLGEDDAFHAAAERSKQACLTLQKLAADNGIDVDLKCPEEEEEGQ